MVTIILLILGLCFGSFVNALAWRLHEQAKKPTAKNKKLSILHGRSMCPHCRHELSVLDLIPVVSWIFLRGKCRYCQKSISIQYPLIELLTAVIFVISYLTWPYNWENLASLLFGLWLMSVVILMSLLIYDLKWMLLPNKLVSLLFGLAALQLLIRLTIVNDKLDLLLGAAWSLIILGGLFYLLFIISKEKCIGGGDVKLGAVLGVIIAEPFSALLVLFLASLLGSLVGVPLMLGGKAGRKTRLPFGPFLIVATVIVYLFGTAIVTWYKTNLLYL